MDKLDIPNCVRSVVTEPNQFKEFIGLIKRNPQLTIKSRKGRKLYENRVIDLECRSFNFQTLEGLDLDKVKVMPSRFSIISFS